MIPLRRVRKVCFGISSTRTVIAMPTSLARLFAEVLAQNLSAAAGRFRIVHHRG